MADPAASHVAAITGTHEALQETKPDDPSSRHAEAMYVAAMRYLGPKFAAGLAVIIIGFGAGGVGGTLVGSDAERMGSLETQVAALERKIEDTPTERDIQELDGELRRQRGALVRLSRNAISEQRYVIDALALLMEHEGIPEGDRPKVPRVISDAQEALELQSHDEWLFGATP